MTPLADQDLRRLFRIPTLKWIYLEALDRVSDEHLAGLSKTRELEILRLERPSITIVGFRYLTARKGLLRLGLAGISVDAERGECIAALDRLEMLWLDDCRFPDGLSFIEGLGRLRNLNLAGATLDAEDVESIAQLPELRELNVNGTAANDAMLERLASIKSLESLSCAGSRVTAEGAAWFRVARPDCKLEF
ncbi:MAG: hypothetical protein WED34_05335 [Planctomycetales bacterium]